MNTPAAYGRLHFAGEAISVRHAWVEGALDSAWHAVAEMLTLSFPAYREKFYKNWGTNPEWKLKVSGIIPQPPDRIPGVEEDLVLQHLRYTHPEYFEQ